MTTNRLRSHIYRLLESHPESAGRDQLVQVAAAKGLPVLKILEQMLLVVPTGNQEFQLIEIGRPTHAVEEFRAGELSFVQRILRVARSEVQIAEVLLGE